MKTAEEVMGKRRGTSKEQCIPQDIWKLIDERQEAKCKRDQSVQGNKEELSQQYASLDKKVKKSCKKDKKPSLRRKKLKQTRLLRKMILRRYSKLSKN